jgi:hypothetical protein
MQGEDLDTYIAKYEGLVLEAGFNLRDRLCLKMFTDGLPHDLYRDILRLDNPRNYDEWKDAALRRQVEYVHCKNRREQLQGTKVPKLYNPFVRYQPRRDPNAMDTSADRGRARLAGVEDVLHNEGYQREQQQRSAQVDQQLHLTPANSPSRPPFLPRQGYFQQQRERRDMMKVQCFNCQGYGHISRYCSQGRANRNKDSTCPGTTQARTLAAEGEGTTPLERANTWLRGVGGESEEVKNMILQTMWKNEDFPDA